MVNRKHFDRVMGLIEGEKVILGGVGREETLQIAPTVLDNVSPDAPVMQEEIFGPVLPVLTFKTLEEAESFVTSREKPLALYLFTGSRAVERRILKHGLLRRRLCQRHDHSPGPLPPWALAAWGTAGMAAITEMLL